MVAAVAAGSLPAVARADELAAGFAADALEACERGRRAEDAATRRAWFNRGRMLGERAVALDDESAETHFALFCNLGELLRVDGERLTSLLEFRRMMAELERTLEIRPDHVDALAAKGVLLIRLPYLLGGDTEKGEALLHEVIRRDPTAVTSRLTLAELYRRRGDREGAVALAAAALQSARATGQADDAETALVLLTELGATRSATDRVVATSEPALYFARQASERAR
jgi:tetratricopeptide (TPR) repeat protein